MSTRSPGESCQHSAASAVASAAGSPPAGTPRPGRRLVEQPQCRGDRRAVDVGVDEQGGVALPGQLVREPDTATVVRPGAPVGPQTATSDRCGPGSPGGGGGAAPGGMAIDVDGSPNVRAARAPSSSAVLRSASSITEAATAGSASAGTRWVIPAARSRSSAAVSPRGTTPTGMTWAARERSIAPRRGGAIRHRRAQSGPGRPPPQPADPPRRRTGARSAPRGCRGRRRPPSSAPRRPHHPRTQPMAHRAPASLPSAMRLRAAVPMIRSPGLAHGVEVRVQPVRSGRARVDAGPDNTPPRTVASSMASAATTRFACSGGRLSVTS